MIRSWVQSFLRGDEGVWPFPPVQDLSQILAVANEEGVVALVHQGLQRQGSEAGIPEDLRRLFADAARMKAVESLMREAVCRRLLKRFEDAGLEVLLLKGTALAYWAYASAALRESADIDFLFRSKAEVDAAIPILAELGYELRDGAMPGDLVGFELTCERKTSGGAPQEIDLHWYLSSSPIFAFRFSNQELWSNAKPLPQLAPNAYGLAPVPAYLNACMHRIQNMEPGIHNRLKWLYDLHVLGQGFSAEDWKLLAETAKARGLAGVCVDGLDAAADLFGECAPEPTRVSLVAASRQDSMNLTRMRSWRYIQWMTFCAFPTHRMRFRWLRQRLIPGRDYMRDQYGRGSGLFTLLAARFQAGLRRIGI